MAYDATISADRNSSSASSTLYRAFQVDGLDHPLLQQNLPSGAFQSKVFMKALFATIAPAEGAKPIFIRVETHNSRQVAFFVFTLRRRFGAQVLEGLDFNVTDYFAPLLFSDEDVDPDKIWLSVLSALPAADAITIKKVPQLMHGKPHALTGAKILKSMGAAAFSAPLRNSDGTAVDLTSFSAAKDVRRKLKKLSAHGTVQFAEAETELEIKNAMRNLFAFRAERFSTMRRSDPLAKPSYRAFYEALALTEERLGRLFSIAVEGEVVGVIYALSHLDTVTVLIPAMSSDPKWTAGSPGLVALFQTVQHVQSNGCSIFDLSVGSYGYKTRFNAKRNELFEYQRAFTLKGLPVVLEAAARRTLRNISAERPKLRSLLEKLREIRQ